MHKWVGNVGFVGTDTEMNLFMQDAQIRKFLEELGIKHYSLFFAFPNPDGVTEKTSMFSRLLMSESPDGGGELQYTYQLSKALIYHLDKLLEGDA